jgi:glycosyltransferase involved in cell wall biosynthesis
MDFNDKTDKTDKTRFCIITAMKNSSSTIVRCANSVLSQLFRDFRWIVVDDHSTDNSWQKLESISKNKPFITLVKNNGKGMGDAWNTGLDYCKNSDYILFLDSDDCYTNKYVLQRINEKLLKSNDTVDCLLLSYYNEKARRSVIFDATTMSKAIYHHATAPWSKCVKTEFLMEKECRFPTGKRCCNDTVQDFILFSKIKKVSSVSTPIVFYGMSGSTSVWNNLTKNNKIPIENSDAINAVLDTIKQLEWLSFENPDLDKKRLTKIDMLKRYLPTYLTKDVVIDFKDKPKYKKSVLTCIFGRYDLLRDPEVVDKDTEYVCVTDYNTLKSSVWNIKVVDDNFLEDKSDIYKTFYVKQHPFEFVNGDVCLILDASIQIKKSLEDMLNIFYYNNYNIGVVSNSLYTDLKDEISSWKRWFSNASNNKRFTEKDYDAQINLVSSYGMLYSKCNINGGFRILRRCKTTDLFNEFVWSLLNYIPSEQGDICRLDQPLISIVLEKFLPEEKVFVMTRAVFQGGIAQLYKHNSKTEVAHVMTSNYSVWFRNKEMKPSYIP